MTSDNFFPLALSSWLCLSRSAGIASSRSTSWLPHQCSALLASHGRAVIGGDALDLRSAISEVLLPRRRQQIVELAELRNGNGHIPGFSIGEGLLSALAV